MAESIIQTRQLKKIFNIGQNNEVSVIRGVDLDLAAGSATVLKGPSGSGKTTLLTLLGCLAKPTSGSYACLGQQVTHWSEKFLTHFRQQHIGIVFQHFHLIPGLSAAWNIGLPLIPRAMSPRQIERNVMETAEIVDITHRLDFPVDTLSGGEMQRVAIARALVANPEIIIADEPTAHLDSGLADHILGILTQLKRNGKTILIATHDPLVEQSALVDRVLMMRDGALV